MSITPDGKRAVSGSYDKTLRVWDIDDGRYLAIYLSNSPINNLSGMSVHGRLAFGTSTGEVILFKLHNFPMDVPIVTPMRIWLIGNNGTKGRWDNDITSTCLWCGTRFVVQDKILNAIRTINNNAGFTPDQSPCLELPAEAWDEPRLLSECPHCRKPLKFNPFIVDNRDRY